jgi:hypothetical protein
MARFESFNSRLRDEPLALEIFDLVRALRFMLAMHQVSYYNYHQHSARDKMTLVDLATQ